LKQLLPYQGTILIKSLEDMGSHKKTSVRRANNQAEIQVSLISQPQTKNIIVTQTHSVKIYYANYASKILFHVSIRNDETILMPASSTQMKPTVQNRGLLTKY
jgi:hypothetical protein